MVDLQCSVNFSHIIHIFFLVCIMIFIFFHDSWFSVLLSKVSQKEKDKYHMISIISGI